MGRETDRDRQKCYSELPLEICRFNRAELNSKDTLEYLVVGSVSVLTDIDIHTGVLFIPAEAASTLSLSAVVVPQSDVSLVERCFTQTALERGGPQRRGALA